MTISYNKDLLDRYLAPGISSFTACDAPDVSAAHPQAPHWLANHFINSVFRGQFRDKYRQFAFNLILRSQVAFSDYHLARTLTLEYLAAGRPDNPASRVYFQAIARWESCLLNFQILVDVLNRLRRDLGDTPVFIEGDGSPEQRAYAIANAIKHFGSDIAAGRISDDVTIPLWLTNPGLATRAHLLSYQELGYLVGEAARAADELQDPKGFAANP